MKWLYAALGIVVAVPLAFFAALYAASELGGEVVVLHRNSADGSVDRVRIWIVQDGSGTWVEHGSPDADWITQLSDDPLVTIERNGQAARYRASLDPASHRLYHELRRADYGLADQFVALVVGDADSCPGVPVRIEAVAQ